MFHGLSPLSKEDQHFNFELLSDFNKEISDKYGAIYPVFGMEIPTACTDVPSEILYTRDTWKDKEAYDEQALMLAKKFIKNFEKYEAGVAPEIRTAAPLT